MQNLAEWMSQKKYCDINSDITVSRYNEFNAMSLIY